MLLLVDMMNDISENLALSHRGEKRQNIVWSLKTRLLNTLRKIISIVQQRNSKSIKKVLEWVQKEENITFMKRKRLGLDGGGQKLIYVELEEEVISWIQQRRSNMLHVSRKF